MNILFYCERWPSKPDEDRDCGVSVYEERMGKSDCLKSIRYLDVEGKMSTDRLKKTCNVDLSKDLQTTGLGKEVAVCSLTSSHQVTAQN